MEEKAKFKPGDKVTVDMRLAHGVHVHDAPGTIVSNVQGTKQYWVNTNVAVLLLEEEQFKASDAEEQQAN